MDSGTNSDPATSSPCTGRGPSKKTCCRPVSEKDRGIDAFNALRESARKNGIQDMSIDEIDEEIRRARKGLVD